MKHYFFKKINIIIIPRKVEKTEKKHTINHKLN